MEKKFKVGDMVQTATNSVVGKVRGYEPEFGWVEVEWPAGYTSAIQENRLVLVGRMVADAATAAAETVWWNHVGFAPRPTSMPTVDQLAHALWLEDGEVERHIEDRYDVHLGGNCDPARVKVAQQRAWERDDLGKRTAWTRTAEAVIERLRGAR